MNSEYRKEATKQYFNYFKIGFIVLAVLLIVYGVLYVTKGLMASGTPRTNLEAPTERVYDYADVLTEEEEEKLAAHIADCEAKAEIDIVVVTVNGAVEYGIDEAYFDGLNTAFHAFEVEEYDGWYSAMTKLADNFFDYNHYGYTVDSNGVNGDGVVFLDNWYEDETGYSQKGTYLSTSGKAWEYLYDDDVDDILTVVDKSIDYSPYKAYYNAVTECANRVAREGKGTNLRIPGLLVLFAPIVIAVVFAVGHSKGSGKRNQVAPRQYVTGPQPVIRDQKDQFVRTVVTTRIIESSSGSGGGGGGHSSHSSSSGGSHGGGGHRR